MAGGGWKRLMKTADRDRSLARSLSFSGTRQKSGAVTGRRGIGTAYYT